MFQQYSHCTLDKCFFNVICIMPAGEILFTPDTDRYMQEHTASENVQCNKCAQLSNRHHKSRTYHQFLINDHFANDRMNHINSQFKHFGECYQAKRVIYRTEKDVFCQ